MDKRGFWKTDEIHTCDHELDKFLPVPGSSVVTLNEVYLLIQQEIEESEEEFHDANIELEEPNEYPIVDLDDEVDKYSEEDPESRSSFTSSVGYSYSFCEVSFLVYKLSQYLEKKFNLKERKGLSSKENEKLPIIGEFSGKQRESDTSTFITEEKKREKKRLWIMVNVEKLSKVQDCQLAFISIISNKNKNKWINIKEKIIDQMKIEEDTDLTTMRMLFKKEMRAFIENEVRELKFERIKSEESEKIAEIKPSKTAKKMLKKHRVRFGSDKTLLQDILDSTERQNFQDEKKKLKVNKLKKKKISEQEKKIDGSEKSFSVNKQEALRRIYFLSLEFISLFYSEILQLTDTSPLQCSDGSQQLLERFSEKIGEISEYSCFISLFILLVLFFKKTD